MPAIQLEKISKTFSNTKAVQQVSLNIPEGIIFGLLGPNGAGKTTLIRIITNIIAADEEKNESRGTTDVFNPTERDACQSCQSKYFKMGR